MAGKRKKPEETKAQIDSLAAESEALKAQKQALVDVCHQNMIQLSNLHAESIGLLEHNIAILESHLDFYRTALAHHRQKLREQIDALLLENLPDGYRRLLTPETLPERPAPDAP